VQALLLNKGIGYDILKRAIINLPGGSESQE
jgi:hypothetical protein